MPEDSKFLDVILEALLVGCGGEGGAYVISSNTLLCKRLSETLPSGFTASVYTVII